MLEVPYLAPTLPDDRSGRFIATGVILTLMAVLSGCATAMIPLSLSMQRQNAQMIAAMQRASTQPGGTPMPQLPPNYGQPQVGPLVVVGVMYLGFTVAAGWIAIAAFLKRRYVRPLVMIFGTHGLIIGGLSMLAMLLVFALEGPSFSTLSSGATRSFAIGMLIATVFGVLFTVGLPLSLILLMKPDAVRETAEHYDLRRRWTDGVPLKLLGLVLTLAIFALFDLTMLGNPRLPVVFTVLSGPVVVIFALAHAALMASAAVLVYRRRMLGWHIAMAGITVPLVLFGLSSLLLPSAQFMEISNNDAYTVDYTARNEQTFRAIWMVTSGVFLVATVVYLVRVRPLVEPPMAVAVDE